MSSPKTLSYLILFGVICYIIVLYSGYTLYREIGMINDTAVVQTRKVAEFHASVDGLTGEASYYDYVLDSGWSSVGHYVCAVRDFEKYSMVKATNMLNGRSVICKVTDYVPDELEFPERIIDLSSTAYKEIADLEVGVIPVRVEYVGRIIN